MTETARAVSGDSGRARETGLQGGGEGNPELSNRAEALRDGPGGPERTPRSLRGEGDPNGRGGSGPFVTTLDDRARELAPIAGDDFRDWSERLRDVEEMIDDPALRAEAARIRDQARGLRSEIKRHSKEPNWDLVRLSVAEPLKELGRRIGNELLRRESRDSLVPIDSDPVPPEYSERVREYYERLGSGK